MTLPYEEMLHKKIQPCVPQRIYIPDLISDCNWVIGNIPKIPPLMQSQYLFDDGRYNNGDSHYLTVHEDKSNSHENKKHFATKMTQSVLKSLCKIDYELLKGKCKDFDVDLFVGKRIQVAFEDLEGSLSRAFANQYLLFPDSSSKLKECLSYFDGSPDSRARCLAIYPSKDQYDLYNDCYLIMDLGQWAVVCGLYSGVASDVFEKKVSDVLRYKNICSEKLYNKIDFQMKRYLVSGGVKQREILFATALQMLIGQSV